MSDSWHDWVNRTPLELAEAQIKDLKREVERNGRLAHGYMQKLEQAEAHIKELEEHRHLIRYAEALEALVSTAVRRSAWKSAATAIGR